MSQNNSAVPSSSEPPTGAQEAAIPPQQATEPTPKAVITEDTPLDSLTPAQIIELQQKFLEENTPERPFIAELAPLSVLRSEYESGSQSFVRQIDYLASSGFINIRRTRGDGDCFYRSIAFSYVENLMYASDPHLAVMSAISLLESTKPLLEQAGFQTLVYEDFFDALLNLVENIIKPDLSGRTLSPATLLEAFTNPETSNSIVVYLRLLTSAQIRAAPTDFEAFLFHPELGVEIDVRTFCENFVEATGREADHVQMTALSRVLRLNVKVAYLDGRNPDGMVDFVDFENSADGPTGDAIVLLYRPGHYDILDKREASR